MRFRSMRSKDYVTAPGLSRVVLVVNSQVVDHTLAMRNLLENPYPTTPETISNLLGVLAADPDTTGWGSTRAGTTWFTGGNFKGWNGTEIVILG